MSVSIFFLIEREEKMYYLLNYLPFFIQMITHVLVLSSKISLNIDFGLYMIISLFILPIYLLLVNGYYILVRGISCKLSCTYMLSVIFLNVLVFMITHKIQQGTFIGDVPEGLLYLWIGIPSAIILIGIIICYLIIRK